MQNVNNKKKEEQLIYDIKKNTLFKNYFKAAECLIELYRINNDKVHLENAEHNLNQLLQDNNERCDVLFLRATVMLMLGDPKEAVNDFINATKLGQGIKDKNSVDFMAFKSYLQKSYEEIQCKQEAKSLLDEFMSLEQDLSTFLKTTCNYQPISFDALIQLEHKVNQMELQILDIKSKEFAELMKNMKNMQDSFHSLDGKIAVIKNEQGDVIAAMDKTLQITGIYNTQNVIDSFNKLEQEDKNWHNYATQLKSALDGWLQAYRIITTGLVKIKDTSFLQAIFQTAASAIPGGSEIASFINKCISFVTKKKIGDIADFVSTKLFVQFPVEANLHDEVGMLACGIAQYKRLNKNFDPKNQVGKVHNIKNQIEQFYNKMISKMQLDEYSKLAIIDAADIIIFMANQNIVDKQFSKLSIAFCESNNVITKNSCTVFALYQVIYANPFLNNNALFQQMCKYFKVESILDRGDLVDPELCKDPEMAIAGLISVGAEQI